MTVVRRVVPNDNSCLFYALAYLCEGASASPAVEQRLRGLAAEAVLKDPDPETRALFLGKRAQLLHQAGKPSLRPKPFAFGAIETGLIDGHGQLRHGLSFQRFNFIKQRHRVRKIYWFRRSPQTKKGRPLGRP